MNPFALHVSGTADKVQAAFGTEVHDFEKGGTRFHANVREAHLAGEAAGLVASVGGLNSNPMQPLYERAVNPATSNSAAFVPLQKVQSASAGLAGFFTNNCFHIPTSYTIGTEGQLPVGVFYGNVYGQPGKSCGYTAAQMQTAYGLPAVYAEGQQGKGQTIAVIAGYGSATLTTDVNNFCSLMGLPKLTSSNLETVYSNGMPYNPSLGNQWVPEVSLDVEWSHAIAPAAKIVVVAAPSGDNQDLEYAIQYAAMNKLGTVISGSFGEPEVEIDSYDLEAYNTVIEQAAAMGISVNFASGDQADLGFGTSDGTVITPSDSPYATAVGGTSLGVPGGTGLEKEVGWGNNQTFVAFSSTVVSDPPYNFGTVDGAGGGSSLYFSKPVWQNALPGSYRLDPDVAMDADPYTGAIVTYTDPIDGPIVGAMGGTSLATPMFSAMWALASERAGHSLGQAAPIIYKLPTDALHDIVPATSPTNVVGTIIDNAGATFYSAVVLADPEQATDSFTSAVWAIDGEFLDLSFGTDGALTTATGWDDVTGIGSPDGFNFVSAAARH